MATLYYRPVTTEPIKDEEFPPQDAMENILPEYKYIFLDPDNTISRQPTLDSNYSRDVERQLRELDRYRTAVQRMGHDILALRKQIQELTAENGRLLEKLRGYDDTTAMLLEAPDFDGLSKAEIAHKYVALKRTVTSQSMDLKKYKDRVVELQNDLIKSNDKQKDLTSLSVAHQTQQEKLHKLQERSQKAKRLEEACRKQEKVIEKLEKLLTTKNPTKNIDVNNKAVLEENKKLREELGQVKDMQQQMIRQSNDDEEILRLQAQLDKAESRILSLERQMDENARLWAREKSELKLQLQEATYGLPPTRAPKLDYITPQPRRFSKAPYTSVR